MIVVVEALGVERAGDEFSRRRIGRRGRLHRVEWTEVESRRTELVTCIGIRNWIIYGKNGELIGSRRTESELTRQLLGLMFSLPEPVDGGGRIRMLVWWGLHM